MRVHFAIVGLSLSLFSPFNHAQSEPDLTFPQIADGGGISVEILLTNPSLQKATGTIIFRDSGGQPLFLVIGGQPSSSVPYSIEAGSVLRIQSAGSGETKVGYATVVSNEPDSQVTGTIVFTLGGKEVSVTGSPLSAQYHVFVEKNSLANSGVALANPSDKEVNISLFLLDQARQSSREIVLELPPAQHTARFIDELFGLGNTDFIGSLHARSDDPFAMLGLRQRPDGSLATLAGSTTAFPAGIAATLTADPALGALAVHENGEKLFAVTQSDSSGNITGVTGAVWVGPNGEELVVYRGENGLPEKAVGAGNVFLFDNYTDASVDVAVITPDREIEITRSVPVDPLILLQLHSQLLPGSGQPSTQQIDAENLVVVLRVTALLVSLAGCASGDVVFGCFSALVNGLNLISPNDTLSSISSGLALFGCSIGNPASCVSLLIEGAVFDIESSDSEILSIAELIESALARLTGSEIYFSFVAAKITLINEDRELIDSSTEELVGFIAIKTPSKPNPDNPGTNNFEVIDFELNSESFQIRPTGDPSRLGFTGFGEFLLWSFGGSARVSGAIGAGEGTIGLFLGTLRGGTPESPMLFFLGQGACPPCAANLLIWDDPARSAHIHSGSLVAQ